MTKKTYPASFKLKVALEAIKQDLTHAQITSKYEIHQSQITNWKKQALKFLEEGFKEVSKADKSISDDKEKSKLYEQIGKLQVELDWLKKKSNFEL